MPCAVLQGEDVVVEGVPEGTSRVLARSAFGDAYVGEVSGRIARLSSLPVGTHAIEALSVDGAVLGEEFVSVREFVGDDPIVGFATSFDASSTPVVLTWLRQLRCTVVQVYDWMERYSQPLAESDTYLDTAQTSDSNRAALRNLIKGIRESGAVAQAYAPVCAADEPFAAEHPQWLLRRNDGAPESLGDLLQIMDPANVEWQRHWNDVYGRALDALGFNGLHLDTYGYPRMALDAAGTVVSIERGYENLCNLFARLDRMTLLVSTKSMVSRVDSHNRHDRVFATKRSGHLTISGVTSKVYLHEAPVGAAKRRATSWRSTRRCGRATAQTRCAPVSCPKP